SPPATSTKPKENNNTFEVKGRVLGPEGQPVAGAKLYLTRRWSYLDGSSPMPERATTTLDGRFHFTVPPSHFDEPSTVVTATAANHGANWVEVTADRKPDNLTLRLVKDEVPITGQIVDLEGNPIAGATLTVLQIRAAVEEDLGPWLEAVKARQG